MPPPQRVPLTGGGDAAAGGAPGLTFFLFAAVLASMALADHPRVMLPIILYNLVQQVVAGAVGSGSGGKSGGHPAPRRHAIRTDQAVRSPAGTGAPVAR